jgi:hypothetical protein
VGAFAVSDFGIWGLGQGTVFRSVGGFFLLMGVSTALEHGFREVTSCGGGTLGLGVDYGMDDWLGHFDNR